MSDDIEKDEFTEIVDAKIPRVDLVGGAANGHRFLFAKSEAGMIPADMVADLIEKADAAADEGTAAVAEEVEKADGETVDVEEIEESDVEASGDVNDPGSPAWEGLDAANAEQAIELVVALRSNLQSAIAREAQEALVGDDPDDAENVWSLQGALDAAECILGVLAPFAVTEQAEADAREDDDSLVLKSGRVLSGLNEGRIRQASDLLTSVLATMPEPVEKADDAEETVEKADDGEKSELVLVYTQDGGILGAVDPEAITTFAPTPSQAPAAEEDADEAASDTDAAATDTGDASADAGREIPGTDTVQAPAPTADESADEEDVTKGQNNDATALEGPLELFMKALKERDEQIAKMQERLDAFGKMPDDRRSPVFNGAVRQPQEAVRGDVVSAEDVLIKQAQDEQDPMKRQLLLTQILRDRV